MLIQNSNQMLQHLNNGGAFSLDKQGQLQEQSGVARFFQNIGDVFRGLSESGRAKIEARTNQLANAMTDMVAKGDALPNLAQMQLEKLQPEGEKLLLRLAIDKPISTVPDEARPLAKAILQQAFNQYMEVNPNASPSDKLAYIQQERNQMCSNQLFTEINTQAAGVPAEGRPLAKTILQHALKEFIGYSPDASLADKLAYIQQEGKAMTSNTILTDALCNIQKKPTQEQMANFAQAVKDDVSSVFLKQQGKINNDGIHATYLVDSKRLAVESVNGKPVIGHKDLEDVSGDATPLMIKAHTKQLQEAIPDKTLRSFVSMLASQAGVEGGISVILANKATEWGMPSGNVLSYEAGMRYTWPQHKYTIDVTDEAINIGFTIDLVPQFFAMSNDVLLNNEIQLPQMQFTGTASVPLNQIMQPGQLLPDYDLTMNIN